MNFETMSRFHFEPIEKNIRSTKETMRITSHSVTLTQALWKKIGEPEFVSFGYDAEEKALAMKVTTKDDPNATAPVEYQNGGVHLNNAAFVRRKLAEVTGIDLEKKCIVLTRGMKVGDWYVFELRNAEIVSPSKKKVTNA